MSTEEELAARLNKDRELARKIEKLSRTLLDIVAKAHFYADQFDNKIKRAEALRKFHDVRKKEI